MTTPLPLDAAIWLFDEECVFCSGAVAFTLRNEKQPSIRFVAIRSPQGRALALENGIDPDNADTFLFVENGVALGRSDGAIALAGHLRAPASWIRFAAVLPRVVRDAAYGWLARNRYRIFGRQQCLMPDPAQRARFILPAEGAHGGPVGA